MLTPEPGDDTLLASIQERDVHALEQFYDRHRGLAFSLALKLLGDVEEAEDVIQEAFLSVWRSAHTYRPERSSARSWLLSIVHHRAIDKLRGRQSRPRGVALEEGMQVPDGTDVWKQVSASLTGDDVRRALSTLPFDQRETLELAYFKGYTHTQIADMMRVPLGTVKGRMRIGLHKLKGALEEVQPGLVAE